MVYSDVIEQSVAPAFLLGAVASFLSVLNLRYNRIIDQRNLISASEPDQVLQMKRKILTRRARFLNRATILALISAALAATLIVASFCYALLEITEQRGLPALFTISLVFLGVAFIDFSREVVASRSEFKD
ncbi:DUF2721 domain-containing protein [Phenylobacterium sp.]|uniref:DUF2721 domain-containing protein n=1 Tax=Phenylobacterium sp. TaxID=1871053 RepID=UPI002F42C481